ncbi:MAG: DUF1178 family protein [Sulfitobacter sp.]
MIQYALKCGEGHGFDSWFKSAEAFEALQKAGHVVCAHCGNAKVEKAIMAPRVNKTNPGIKTGAAKSEENGALSMPVSDQETALADLRRKIEDNAQYVGGNFAKEARAMHLGDMPERAIYGEALPEEAKSMIEDGIPLAPLPFIPKRKAN